MRLLAIDTATEACSVALWIDGLVGQRHEVLGRGHAEHVLPMVDAVLAEAGVALATLDAIAFGRGPGAFTGVRIAVSVAQGLAFGASLPVVPVSNLAAVAARVARPGVAQVVVCMDARMGQVYWAPFCVADADRPEALLPESVADPGAVRLPRGGDWFGAGHGFATYPALHTLLGRELISFDAGVLPHAADIARLGAALLQAGQALPAEQALPVYLRDDVATRARRP
jgi:tRNA threonylcarbamoyladenosine biosynthesis protein TsaB